MYSPTAIESLLGLLFGFTLTFWLCKLTCPDLR